jgi:hypothetical protein
LRIAARGTKDFHGACRIRAKPRDIRPARNDAAFEKREKTMRYMLLIYNDEAAMANAPRERTEQILAAYGAYTEALKKSGAWLAGDRLKPTQSATVVRMANGKTNVLDGPYADTKEQLAGFYMIEATDIDTAIEWGSRCPAASTGTVEVRPIWEMTEYLSEK